MRRVIVILSVIFSFILSADLITAACTPGDRLCCDAGHFRTCQSTGLWGACYQCAEGLYCNSGTCIACSCTDTTSLACFNNKVYRCTGCNYTFQVEDCGTYTCTNGACDTGGGGGSTDACQAGDVKCYNAGVSNYLDTCNTDATPYEWSHVNGYGVWCDNGCDAAPDPDACIGAVTIPYCENKACGGGGCAVGEQSVWCWEVYDDGPSGALNDYLDDLADDGEANNPAWTDCVTGCDTVGCHPTENWCIGNESPCPVASLPTATEKWLDNCGGIDCKIPTTTSCGGSTPGPTPTPVPTAPRCDSMSLSASPATLVVGQPMRFTATTTSTNFVPDDAVERVEFVVTSGAGNFLASFTDDAIPYEFDYTPTVAGDIWVTATGLFSAAGSIPCTDTNVYTLTAPSCNSLTLSATPIVMGQEAIFTATVLTSNYNPSNMIDSVQFSLNGAPQTPDTSFPYEFRYTPSTDTPFTVSATGSFTSSASTCTDSVDYTPTRPSVSVTVRVYETTTSLCTSGSPLSASIAILRSLDPSVLYSRSQGTNNLGVTTFNPVEGGGVIYELSVEPPLGSGYVFQSCGIGAANPRQHTLGNVSITSDFYFIRQADAWFQVLGGDVMSLGNMSVVIPGSPMLSFLAHYLNTTDSGVALASGAINVDGVVGPDPNRDWLAEGSTYITPPQENYDYFFTLYEMGAPTDGFGGVPEATISWNEPPEKISDDSSEEAYYREGDLIVDSSPPSGVKRTVFVEGDLTVGGDVVVPPGEFLAFIVSGDITFTGDVVRAQGVYIADGTITVDNMHQSVTTVALRQFRGEGIFVGWGGVNLGRDLDSGGTPADDLDNNTAAGETFTYRGDFLINAPAGLKRLGIAWKEVAPQGP